VAKGQDVMSWPIETIPDNDKLFMRIHENWILQTGEPMPGAFRNQGSGMSTDWNKYSTPEEALKRARVPSKNGIIQMQVSDVRKIPGQNIQHSPLPDNRAHTDVLGEKDRDPEVRIKFRRIYTWAIPYKAQRK
jgi:hypothetical protein